MKNHKQIVIKNSIAEMLDGIRKRLPLRGNTPASYGDAIIAINNQRNEQKITIQGLQGLIKAQKKVRK